VNMGFSLYPCQMKLRTRVDDLFQHVLLLLLLLLPRTLQIPTENFTYFGK
jgi:hypothetical protein